ncbi:MAG: hypothetical protein ABFD60_01515 [Bryobacteraceae bacterium]
MGAHAIAYCPDCGKTIKSVVEWPEKDTMMTMPDTNAALKAENDNLRSVIEVWQRECGGRDADIDHLKADAAALREALEMIADPVAYFAAEAKRRGEGIDGVMAARLADDAGWLRAKALAALASARRAVEGLCPNCKGKGASAEPVDSNGGGTPEGGK